MIGRANDGRTNDGRTPVLEFVKCLNMCKNQKVEENMPVPTAKMIFFFSAFECFIKQTSFALHAYLNICN